MYFNNSIEKNNPRRGRGFCVMANKREYGVMSNSDLKLKKEKFICKPYKYFPSRITAY